MSEEKQNPEKGKGLSRRERELARNRRELLEAAERLLVRKPYSSISMQEIATEAEFSVGYIYKFFEGKEELYLSLLMGKKHDLYGILKGLLENPGSYRDRLEQLIHGYFKWLTKNPDFSRSNLLDMKTLMRRHVKQGWEGNALDLEMKQALLGFFERAAEAGDVVPNSAEEMARTLRALIWGFVEDDFHQENKDWTEYAPIIVRIMFRAYAPEPRQKA